MPYTIRLHASESYWVHCQAAPALQRASITPWSHYPQILHSRCRIMCFEYCISLPALVDIRVSAALFKEVTCAGIKHPSVVEVCHSSTLELTPDTGLFIYVQYNHLWQQPTAAAIDTMQHSVATSSNVLGLWQPDSPECTMVPI
eukprot:GHUV01056776.1.p1 GENE.GHUV01056776.1~~GHUV01056776.1.p1  ORF type:complete len:144 (+),score=11.85 GHUV01056776.1:114-545(+)